MSELVHRIKRAYAEALEGEKVRIHHWYQHFRLRADPFGDPFEEDADLWGKSADWIVGLDQLAETLAKDIALVERGYNGCVPIVGAPGSGRKTLARLVASSLERQAHFRELSEEPEGGKLNFVLGDTFKVNTKVAGAEFILFSNVQYSTEQTHLREQLLDEIWLWPLSSEQISEILRRRLDICLDQGGDSGKILSEGGIREVCRFSLGLPGAALELIRSAFIVAFRLKLDSVADEHVRRAARQLGFEAALRDYPRLSEAIRNVAVILVKGRRPLETGQVAENYDAMFLAGRDRSVISRHLNKLVAMNLAHRHEVGRAASYEAAKALIYAVEKDYYPRV